jgi:hypothetical protein
LVYVPSSSKTLSANNHVILQPKQHKYIIDSIYCALNIYLIFNTHPPFCLYAIYLWRGNNKKMMSILGISYLI